MTGKITVNGVGYKVGKLLGRGDSEVYKAEREDGRWVALKVFGVGKRASKMTRGSKTHYGVVREASDTVFQETLRLQRKFPLMMRYLDRGKSEGAEGWRWVLVMQYKNGVNFLEHFFSICDNLDEMKRLSQMLGSLLRRWHDYGVAHGDGGLNNVVYSRRSDVLWLVDYNQLHHSKFTCCKKIGCFTKFDRYAQDLVNDNQLLGRGFRRALEVVGECIDRHDVATLPNKAREISRFLNLKMRMGEKVGSVRKALLKAFDRGYGNDDTRTE